MKISFSVTDEEFREIWMATRARHIGGRTPESAYAKFAVFGYMAKYPLPEAIRAKLEKAYSEEVNGAKAAQFDDQDEKPGG